MLMPGSYRVRVGSQAKTVKVRQITMEESLLFSQKFFVVGRDSVEP